MKGHYVDGDLDGLATEWFENGCKKVKATFKRGKMHGKVRGWTDKGRKMIVTK